MLCLAVLCSAQVPVQAASAASAAGSAGSAGSAASAPNAREWANAQCVAALDLQTERLALKVHGGQTELRELLMARMRAGGALIGQSWLDGERDEKRSKDILTQARRAQRSLSAADLEARQNRCAAQGEKMLAEANAIGRMAVNRLADRQVKRLLDKAAAGKLDPESD